MEKQGGVRVEIEQGTLWPQLGSNPKLIPWEA